MKVSSFNHVMIFLGLIIIFSAFQIASAQQSLKFENEGFTAALEQSRTNNKPVFFMCYASWCPHCKKMKEQVFTDSSVADFYNQHFICIEQDMEKGGGITLHEKFKIRSYPTLIFFDSNGVVIYRTTGEFKAHEFITEGINALTPQKQLPFLQKQFELDVSNSENCYEYLRALKKGDIDYTEMVKKYFSTQSEKDLLSEKNWRIIANGTTGINSREFQFVLSHQKEFASLASPERVERKIFSVVKELLNPLVNAKDTINYFVYRRPAADIHLPVIDSLIFKFDIKLYENTENWDAYKKQTLQSAGTYSWNDYGQLNEIATLYLKHISDNAALLQAVNWTNHSLALHEDYNTYILSAKLYRKLNDIQAAIQMAKQAKELAIKYEWDYSEAAKLIKDYSEIK